MVPEQLPVVFLLVARGYSIGSWEACIRSEHRHSGSAIGGVPTVQAANISPISRPRRQASPERWQRAAQRAIAEHIEVRQINSQRHVDRQQRPDPKVAYMLEIVAGRGALLLLPGRGLGRSLLQARRPLLPRCRTADPEPEPPAPAVPCFKCRGADPGCSVCGGAGVAPLAAQAAATQGRRRHGREPTDLLGPPSQYVGRAGHVAGILSWSATTP